MYSKSSKLFCLPVNDETDLSLHVGGCHWSLLVHTPAVTAELIRRGYSESDIAKIWGGNLLRVMREVEAAAR